MTVKHTLGTLALGSLLASCVATPGTVDLRADSRLMGGTEAAAQFNAPEEWFVGSKTAAHIELRAPDNYSSLTAVITPVLADASHCPELALQAARSIGSKDTECTSVQSDVIDFARTVPGTPPGPSDRKVFGRAICRNGALAVLICSVGVERFETLGAECRKALESLSIQTVVAAPAQPAPQQPAPEMQQAAPEVPQQPAPEVQQPAPEQQQAAPEVPQQPAPEAQQPAPEAQQPVPEAQQ